MTMESQRLIDEVRARNTSKEHGESSERRLLDEIAITVMGLQSSVARHERKFAQTSARIDEVEQMIEDLCQPTPDPDHMLLPDYVANALRPMLAKLRALATDTKK